MGFHLNTMITMHRLATVIMTTLPSIRMTISRKACRIANAMSQVNRAHMSSFWVWTRIIQKRMSGFSLASMTKFILMRCDVAFGIFAG